MNYFECVFFSRNVFDLGDFCGMFWNVFCIGNAYTYVPWSENGDVVALFSRDGNGRRKFRSQTSDNMDRLKAEMGRVREEKRIEEERISKKRKSQKKEDPGARKGRKVAKHCVFSMICGSGGSKSRLAKAAGAEPCGQMRDEKLHAVVARSTFPSQNAHSTPTSDHFWKL